MPSLTTAISTIHRDRAWWRKTAVGGGLWLTVVGYPLVEGYQIESIENTQSGYPTPLPHWNAVGNKLIYGIFALVIDFFYFVLPLILGGLLLLCMVVGLGIAGAGQGALEAVAQAGGGVIVAWLAFAWGSSLSPIAKLRYVKDGDPASALSGTVVRQAWSSPARSIYWRARLQSLPAYLPSAALFIAAWWSVGGWWVAMLGLLWLALSALLYARMVVVQIYDQAAREIQQRNFEAFQARIHD